MGGSSKKQTIGYKYYLGMHLILTHGPVDKLIRIKVDDRTAWVGDSTSGSISINKPQLFGGDSREGGVSGTVDFENGSPTQPRNSYLQSILGSEIPAFRGVSALVLRQCYLGNNPYLKRWSERIQRIYKKHDGLEQWYVEKSGIPSGAFHASLGEAQVDLIAAGASGWKYELIPNTDNEVPYTHPDIDDSSWPTGVAPFGDEPGLPHPYTPPGYSSSSATLFPGGKTIILRKQIDVEIGRPVMVQVFHDNESHCYFDGVAATDLGLVSGDNPFWHNYIFTPFVSSGLLAITVHDSGEDDGPGGNRTHADAIVWQPAISEGTPVPEYDMNPAHIIRECLTNLDWGMGYQESDIDDVSFILAADSLYNEAMGISILWDRQIPIEDFVSEIIRHINAALYVDRITGKFTIKLIRLDFDEGDLITFGEDDIDRVDGYGRPAFGEMVNSITVNFWDAYTGKTASVTAQDTALVQLQGSVIGTTLQYPGFTNHRIATQVAMRNLQAMSFPLLSCTIYANRSAANLNIGDAFKFEWPDYHDGYIVMRVTGMALGDGRKNAVRLTCIQDVFSLPEVAGVAESEDEWEDPSVIPSAAEYRIVTEAPYYELVQRAGQTQTDEQLAANPDTGFILASAGRPTGAINATLMVDSGAGYVDSGVVDFSPYAVLSSDIGAGDTTIQITGGDGLDEIVIGTHAQIGAELVRIDVVTDTELIVGRGVLDTVPTEHASGTVVIAWDSFAEGDNVEYASGESIDVKLLPVSGLGGVSIDDATADSVTMDQRALRPYPPGKLTINSLDYPETISGTDALSLAWAHRDRLQQTSGTLQDTTYGDIGPESGTTYTVSIYGEVNTLIKTSSGISTTSFDYPLTNEKNDSAIPASGYAAKDPSAISGLIRWYKADAITGLTDGQTVSTWVDSSTSALDATQATGANKPTYKTNILNGNPVVRFAGSHWLQATEFGDLSNSNFHTFVVSKNNAAATGGLLSMRNPPTHPAPFVPQGWSKRYNDATHASFYFTGSSVVSGPGGTILIADKFNILDFARTNLTTQNGVDGLSNAESVWDAYTPNEFNLVYIGCEQEGTASFLTGDIAEIIVFSAKLSDADKGGLLQYLNEKYFGSSSVSYRQNGKLRVELESVRDSISSFQKHNITVYRRGYGFNYGKFYGGV